MKLDIHGIRFRFWLSFFTMAVGITLFIALLQTGLIRPYYRNAKIASVKTVADYIQQKLIRNSGSDNGIQSAIKETVNNNACIAIYNDKGVQIYDADSLGTGCALNDTRYEELRTLMDFSTIDTLLENDERSINLTNQTTGQEMIVYVRSIHENLGNYYLFVNTALEPIDSVVTFFTRQYLLYTVVVIVIASIVSFMISRLITDPIIKMNHEAVKLSHADYSAHFEGGSFTELQQLAGSLNTANLQLSKIDELRRDLLANVSHDIRTPMTDIRAYAEMIRDISGDDPIKRDKHLDVIIKETDYMTRLINDMSELSKMQSGNYVLHYTNMDLSNKIREIIELNQSSIQNGGQIVELKIPGSLYIYADEVKIGQVITNFLSNALKHTATGQHIYISAYIKKDEETVHFEIRDEGEGIQADDLPYVWDRYHKTSSSFSRNQMNTGLGLAIVKAILDAHHFQYGVISTVGKGSTFWFELRETHEA
ncbi:MAG: HAMP domain-containing histidine kinase [Erysipelotrichaceae bacterium]|nr:HAMP domain-containing histidine kinase [Erysipelotrichaceae bacterium]